MRVRVISDGHAFQEPPDKDGVWRSYAKGDVFEVDDGRAQKFMGDGSVEQVPDDTPVSAPMGTDPQFEQQVAKNAAEDKEIEAKKAAALKAEAKQAEATPQPAASGKAK